MFSHFADKPNIFWIILVSIYLYHLLLIFCFVLNYDALKVTTLHLHYLANPISFPKRFFQFEKNLYLNNLC